MNKCGKGKRWSIKHQACVYKRKKATNEKAANRDKAIKGGLKKLGL